MRQLVGTSCVLCKERIGSIIDGQFCQACGCPVHKKCIQPAATTDGAPRCAACGAAIEHQQREQALHQQHEVQHGRNSVGRGPRVWIAGLIGFGIMTVTSCNSTINPAPDGRLMNTAPALGFDIFLPIGLLGMGFCLVRLVMGR